MFLASFSAMRTLDIVAILCYIVVIVLIGLYFSKKNKSTEEYFLGGRGFPGWVIGLSMVGTSISSNSFLGIPAETYKSNWTKIAPNFFLPVVAVIAIIFFIPFFRRGGQTSAFEYLQDRYGKIPRLYGVFSFVVLQIIRVSSVLFLLCMPIQFMTGFSIQSVIICLGIFVGLYTIIGGIEAVIWTDVIQTIVLLFGGIICLLFIWKEMPGGFGQILEIASSKNKFYMGKFEWSLTEKTFWVIMFTGLFHWLREYSSDQNVIQRYLASKSTKEARKATILCVCFSVPIWIFFAFLGTSLFAFFSVFPVENLASKIGRAENILPFFILNHIPAGIAGIIIAGLLAAAMSSLDSSINAISTVTVIDVVKPYTHKDRDDKFYLRVAKLVAIIVSIIMITGAISMTYLDKTVIDTVWVLISLFGGCLAGLFLLGFFTTRVDSFSALVGLGIALLFNVYLVVNASDIMPLAYKVKIDKYWIGILVNIAFLISAYVISWVKPKTSQNLENLTVWTMK